MTPEAWTALQTPEQKEARRRAFETEPPGWPKIACHRHLSFPLVLSVDGAPYCGLCLKILSPKDWIAIEETP